MQVLLVCVLWVLQKSSSLAANHTMVKLKRKSLVLSVASSSYIGHNWSYNFYHKLLLYIFSRFYRGINANWLTNSSPSIVFTIYKRFYTSSYWDELLSNSVRHFVSVAWNSLCHFVEVVFKVPMSFLSKKSICLEFYCTILSKKNAVEAHRNNMHRLV